MVTMEWLAVIGLLFLGLALLWIEVLLVPGTTLVGLLGLAIWMLGLFLGFAYFGAVGGFWLLAISSLLGVGGVLYGFKVGAWRRFSLRSTHQTRVLRTRDIARAELQVGARGKCRSALRPIGQVAFGTHIVEARTDSGYLPEETEVSITRIEETAIYVAPLSKQIEP